MQLWCQWPRTNGSVGLLSTKQTYKVGSVHDAIFDGMGAVQSELEDLLLLLTTFAGVLLLLLKI